MDEADKESCGYCGLCIDQSDHAHNLPLVCSDCDKSFHVECIEGEHPLALLGDQLFRFSCSRCSLTGRDVWSRPFLNWVHVIHLALYNLMKTETGRKGFFRWNTQICVFIEKNWLSLMPLRRKTASWKCTVAGILSVHCPTLFRSGTQELGETGWWSLQEATPPMWKDVETVLSNDKSRKNYILMNPDDSVDNAEIPSSVSDVTLSRKRMSLADQDDNLKFEKRKALSLESNEYFDYSSFDAITGGSKAGFKDAQNKLRPLSESQEAVVMEHLSQHMCYYSTSSDPKKARLYRKLKLRQRKRRMGMEVFQLERYIKRSVEPVERYVTHRDDDGPTPVKLSDDVEAISCSSESEPYSPSMIINAEAILSKLSLPLIPVLLVKGVFTNNQSPIATPTVRVFTSPYTSRVLKPVIFKSYEFLPTKVKLLKELVDKVSNLLPVNSKAHTPSNKTCKPVSITCMYTPHPIAFCYFGEHHLTSVNALVTYFFWPVNLKEYLQYPDFTVVAQYGKLVVGCAFMTPDVKVSEAYIPFLLVHPDFQGCGIGKVMLYHLIQSCLGKDVTLHVSIDNPAMLLYQQFGFKAEQFCIDFYKNYYPPHYHLSKHAFLMRLRR